MEYLRTHRNQNKKNKETINFLSMEVKNKLEVTLALLLLLLLLKVTLFLQAYIKTSLKCGAEIKGSVD